MEMALLEACESQNGIKIDWLKYGRIFDLKKWMKWRNPSNKSLEQSAEETMVR